VISLDCGADTHFAARFLSLRANQRLTGTGMLASMGAGTALRNRRAVGLSRASGGGDRRRRRIFATHGRDGHGCGAQSSGQDHPAENNALAEVQFEQRDIGNPNYDCELSPIDFVAFAKACGAEAFRCEKPAEVRPAIVSALASKGPALVEAVMDAEEKPADPDELRA
jgi:pyruvate dehydrogenase (quinone)